jgi:uncharacterized membrane protein YcgQ (UPF0703/DUF1980 family)
MFRQRRDKVERIISPTFSYLSGSNIYVNLGYHYLVSNALYLMLFLLLGAVSVHLSTIKVEDLVMLGDQLRFNLVAVILCSAIYSGFPGHFLLND